MNTKLIERCEDGVVRLKQRPSSTQNVYWPNEEAINQNGSTVPVTIFFWNEETNEGQAFLPGIKAVDVERTSGTLRIKQQEGRH